MTELQIELGKRVLKWTTEDTLKWSRTTIGYTAFYGGFELTLIKAFSELRKPKLSISLDSITALELPNANIIEKILNLKEEAERTSKRNESLKVLTDALTQVMKDDFWKESERK